MNIEFLGIIILSLVLAVVLAAYERLQRKFRGIKMNQEEIEARAREKTLRMMEEARDKALLIISQAKMDTTENEGEFKNRLGLVEEKQVEVYRELLHNISNKIESEAMVEISDFKKVLETETIETQQNVEKRIDDEYKNLEVQLEEYKTKRMAELEANAEEVVKEFLNIVARKAFSFEDQRELINKALEEAKKANVF